MKTKLLLNVNQASQLFDATFLLKRDRFPTSIFLSFETANANSEIPPWVNFSFGNFHRQR